MRSAQIIAQSLGVVQEFVGNHSADDVGATVLVDGAAEPISKVACHLARLSAAGLQADTISIHDWNTSSLLCILTT